MATWLWTCRHTFEPTLCEELARSGVTARPLLPGLVRADGLGPATPDELRRLDAVYALQVLPDVQEVRGDSVRALAQGVAWDAAIVALRTLTPVELIRYLDYCSELLSLSAKVAAVYAQSSKDPVVVAASSDLQQITANLSAKIWQKITIVHSTMATEIAEARPGATATATTLAAQAAPPRIQAQAAPSRAALAEPAPAQKPSTDTGSN